MVRKRPQRREGLNGTQRARGLQSGLGTVWWGFCVSRGVERKWIDSLLWGHEAVKLVAQDIGCSWALWQVEARQRFGR